MPKSQIQYMIYNAIIVTKATRKHNDGNMRRMETRHIYTIQLHTPLSDARGGCEDTRGNM